MKKLHSRTLKKKILSSTSYYRFPLNIIFSSHWESDFKGHFQKRERNVLGSPPFWDTTQSSDALRSLSISLLHMSPPMHGRRVVAPNRQLCKTHPLKWRGRLASGALLQHLPFGRASSIEPCFLMLPGSSLPCRWLSCTKGWWSRGCQKLVLCLPAGMYS